MAGSWFNKILTLLIFGGVIFILYKFKDLIKGATTQLKIPGETTEKQSRSDETLKEIAELQDFAMNELGTNEKVLFDSLEGLNKTDLKKVFNFFGTRKYILGHRDDLVGHPANLFIWYMSELSGKDLKKMKTIWEKSGLELTF